jgi:hypothetical protein
MKKDPTVADIEKEVHRLDPKVKKDSTAFKCAVFLLSAVVVGPVIDRLKKFTGYDEAFVREKLQLMRQNDIVNGLRGRKLRVEWFEKETGGLAFWADVAVLEGLLTRSSG